VSSPPMPTLRPGWNLVPLTNDDRAGVDLAATEDLHRGAVVGRARCGGTATWSLTSCSALLDRRDLDDVVLLAVPYRRAG
jgi:hypothetical protein